VSENQRTSTRAGGKAAGGAPVSPLAGDLATALYGELRRLARLFMRGERPGHTLQPTALAHEAYMRLAGQSRVRWQGRTHFMAVAARVMRRVLIDHARAHARGKREGGWRRITLAEGLDAGAGTGLDRDQLLAVDAALRKLEALDPREARVVELRFFVGLSMPEVAEALGVSLRTVEGDWTHARAWLRRELGGE
jgi:RNA polymerase sigma-70 factor (ECF subfamily)